MSLARKVAHNTIIQFVGKAIGMVLALVTVGLMLRYLGQTGFGQYTTIMAYLSVFSILADLGLYLTVTREISKKGVDQDKFLSNAVTIKMVVGLLVLILGSFVVWFFPYNYIVKMGVVVGSLSYLFILLNQTLIGVFQKYFSTYKVALAEIAGRVVWLATVAIVISMRASLLYMIFGIAISNLVNFLILFFASKKYVKIKLSFDLPEWKKILIMTSPLAFSVVFNLIYFKFDTLFLSIMKPESDVGIYGAAYKVLETMITFAAIFAGLLLPVMSRYYGENKTKFINIYQKGFDIIMVFVVPLIIGTYFLAVPIMSFFGGSNFDISGNVLKLLIFPTGAIFLSNMFGNAAVASNLQKPAMWIYIFAAVLAVVLCLVLIPSMSYYGAAISTIASEGSVAILTALLIWWKDGTGLRWKTTGKVLIAGLAMGLLLWLMPTGWNFILRGILAVIIYSAVILIIKAIPVKDIREVFSLKKNAVIDEPVD